MRGIEVSLSVYTTSALFAGEVQRNVSGLKVTRKAEVNDVFCRGV
jgi:hypothetical protein